MEIWQFLLIHAIITAVVAVPANFLRRAVARSSAKAWFISWTAYGVGAGSWFAGGAVYQLHQPTVRGETFAVASGTGSAGVMIGMAIGALIWRYYRREIEGDEDTR